ncbi:gene transfer agent family protein [Methylobacterium sp. E-045]|uniref:gene transfer agent family protein n=1 Tax=Methylobacterium sp. E-045 TaxID=2836575 RepID=UPI001FB9683F|nr:gene transfer agent family protein [Methylobacterium sp. E-045]MCJ2132450.1 gene transfer agent family protein [Methylobacterium sp. E-045]
MSDIDTGRTVVDAPFAGQERRFQLRIGEIGELERLTGVGIGATFMRLGSHQFSVREVWDVIRLGLEGGGTSAVEATALVMRYQDQPLMDFLPLAGRIIAAAVNGVPPGKSETEGTGESLDPATSPSSTPGAPS